MQTPLLQKNIQLQAANDFSADVRTSKLPALVTFEIIPAYPKGRPVPAALQFIVLAGEEQEDDSIELDSKPGKIQWLEEEANELSMVSFSTREEEVSFHFTLSVYEGDPFGLAKKNKD